MCARPTGACRRRSITWHCPLQHEPPGEPLIRQLCTRRMQPTMAHGDHALSTQSRQKLDEATRWHNWGRTDQGFEIANVDRCHAKSGDVGCLLQSTRDRSMKDRVNRASPTPCIRCEHHRLVTTTCYLAMRNEAFTPPKGGVSGPVRAIKNRKRIVYISVC